MKLALLILVAFWAALSAVSIAYVFASKVRIESRQAGKPWQQHPIVEISLLLAVGIFAPVAVALLVSPFLNRLGAPPARMLGWKLGNLVTLLTMLLTYRRFYASQRHPTVGSAPKPLKFVDVEAFFERCLGAWWLPRVVLASAFVVFLNGTAMSFVLMLAFTTYRSMEQRFRTPSISRMDC